MTSVTSLAVHPLSRRLITAFTSDPSHGLLLHGRKGTGLTTVAQAVARDLVSSPNNVQVVTGEGAKGISIEQVRELYVLTRSVRDTRQVVIIDEAESMSPAAQNALLKLLEEPPRLVHFILTSHLPGQLLATIISRVEMIELRPLSPETAQQVLMTVEKNDATKQRQIGFLAPGLPAEMTRLAANDEYFAARSALVHQAKTIIEGTPYQRLVTGGAVARDREQAMALIEMVGAMLLRGDERAITRHASRLQLVADTLQSLHANANTRLQLLNFALNW